MDFLHESGVHRGSTKAVLPIVIAPLIPGSATTRIFSEDAPVPEGPAWA